MCGADDSFTLFANTDILFQVKDSLFANPIVRWILTNAGNIPVDRRNKNNQSLFKGTFEGRSLRILAMSPELNASLSSDDTRRINRSLPRRHIPHFPPYAALQGRRLVGRARIRQVSRRCCGRSEEEGQKGCHRSCGDHLFGQGKIPKLYHRGVSTLNSPSHGVKLHTDRLVIRYGPPITMDAFEQQFLSEEEGANKIAVKRLTKTLELEMMKLTVNAPDW